LDQSCKAFSPNCKALWSEKSKYGQIVHKFLVSHLCKLWIEPGQIALWNPANDICPFGVATINFNSLFSTTQESPDPLDNTYVKIITLQFFSTVNDVVPYQRPYQNK